jgi:hypothetical protein
VGRKCNIGFRIVRSRFFCPLFSEAVSRPTISETRWVVPSTQGTLRKPRCARKGVRLAGPRRKHFLRVTYGSLSSTQLGDVLKAHISPELVQWRGSRSWQQRLLRITGQRGNDKDCSLLRCWSTWGPAFFGNARTSDSGFARDGRQFLPVQYVPWKGLDVSWLATIRSSLTT